jgi:hypothetical protein
MNTNATNGAKNGEDYARDSFRIHVEQRTNGWGFRIQSDLFFCLLCFGGFEDKFSALEFADELIELCATNLE